MDFDVALSSLAVDPSAQFDAAQLCLLAAKDEYPNLDVAQYLERLDLLAVGAANHVHGTLEERVAGLSHYLFDELRFRGNSQDYYDPDNSFLNRVVDRRLGLPITLSVLTAAVGARAGLAVSGVGLPGHFIVMARDGTEAILFDPFHGGQALTPADAEALVQQVTGQPFTLTPEWLIPVTPARLMRRVLTNLKGVYLRRSDFERAGRTIARLRQLDPSDVSEQRDLAVCLMQTGHPGPAIDLLDEYLKQSPPGPEAEQAEQLLRRARIEVARWN
ncbi:MAG: transglutaminase-like domain-containing protein [Gemmataceae bacterium]